MDGLFFNGSMYGCRWCCISPITTSLLFFVYIFLVFDKRFEYRYDLVGSPESRSCNKYVLVRIIFELFCRPCRGEGFGVDAVVYNRARGGGLFAQKAVARFFRVLALVYDVIRKVVTDYAQRKVVKRVFPSRDCARVVYAVEAMHDAFAF